MIDITSGNPRLIMRVQWRNGKAGKSNTIDARRWFQSDAGEWIPTRKGLCCAPEQWDKVIAAVNQLRGV